MEIRKLVKAGPSSHTIALPKDWLDKNKLAKGDCVYINVKSDQELVISPQISQKQPVRKEITIEIDGKDIKTIEREITSAYLNNYGTINISGASVAEKSAELRRVLHNFVALEIAEQTGKQVIAKDLLDLGEVSIEKTIRRMDNTIRSMLQDISNDENPESIITRDFDVNRMYFLLFRLLKNALKERHLAEFVGLPHEQILETWHLVLNLENLADNAKSIAGLMKKTMIDTKKTQQVFAEIESQYTDVMKAYYTKDRKLADAIAAKRPGLISETEKFQPELAQAVREMAGIISTIARIVIDLE